MSSVIPAIRDVATVFALFVGTVSASVAVVSLRRNSRVQKAQFISNLAKDFHDDSDLRSFFYKIDYEKFEFDLKRLDSFKGSADEMLLDALLMRYNMVGRLVRIGVVSRDDVEFMIFDLVQVLKNPAVMRYVSWLDSEYEKYGAYGTDRRLRSFDDARWLLENSPRVLPGARRGPVGKILFGALGEHWS